ncbi:MAG: aminopeptidase [Nitrospirae bacterium]|nr:aminopeptidase [Nitrospirota bacterium]
MPNTITNIFKTNLKLKKNESVLIFTDNYRIELKKITKLIAEQGKDFTKKVKYMDYPSTGSHGAEPPEPAWINAFGKNTVRKLKEKNLLRPLLDKKINKGQLREVKEIMKKFKGRAVNAVIALSHYSTTHTRFKQFLTKICGVRYASMPLFEELMLEGAMSVNWEKMAKRTKDIVRRINKADSIEIKTPNSTQISFSKKGRKARADTGVITRKGSSSNLPAGEAFFAPVEGTAKGRLVLEWAPTRKLKSPVMLEVRKGMAVKVTGKEGYAEVLRKKFSERPENANIAELGIGTNDRASRPDNILESEKILGTIHIALGDNSLFGGKVSTPFHQDFVFFKPTVTLIHKNGKKHILLKDGKLF